MREAFAGMFGPEIAGVVVEARKALNDSNEEYGNERDKEPTDEAASYTLNLNSEFFAGICVVQASPVGFHEI